MKNAEKDFDIIQYQDDFIVINEREFKHQIFSFKIPINTF